MRDNGYDDIVGEGGGRNDAAPLFLFAPSVHGSGAWDELKTKKNKLQGSTKTSINKQWENSKKNNNN